MVLICENSVTLKILLNEFYQQHKTMFLGYAGCMSLMPAKEILISHFFGRFIELLRQKRGRTKDIQWVLIILASVFAVYWAVGYFDAYFEAKLVPQFEYYVRNKLMTSLFDMQTTNYSELESGKIVARATSLPATIASYVQVLADWTLPKILIALGILAYFSFKQPMVALCLGSALVFSAGVTYRMLHRCTTVFQERDHNLLQIIGFLDDLLKNMMSILNANAQQQELAVFRQAHDVFSRQTLDGMKCTVGHQSSIALAMVLAVAASGYLLYKKVRHSAMPIGQLITTILLLGMFINAYTTFTQSMGWLILRLGIIRQGLTIFKQCRVRAAPAAQDAARPPPPPTGFHLAHVRFLYESSTAPPRPIFQDLTVSIPQGKTTLLVGPIGSGKSTLLALLMKYKLPHAGDIFLDGKSYAHLSVQELRSRLGFVPQHPVLFDRTIYENIVYVSPSTPKARVEALFHELGLQRMLADLPLGLDTPCGKNGSFLSGGQRQIVTLMRVVLQDPEILLLDEPTSAVDEGTRSHVMQLLTQLMKGKTVVMVTHDTDLIRFADTVITLAAGGRLVSVVASGSKQRYA